jgi:enamine deaminase RidA (YjgF/YER057c/UK114 family)
MFQSFQGTVARRRLLLGSTISGLGALIGGASSAAAQQPPGPPGIQILQYDPPRRFAAGARVGNIIYLAGEEGMVWTSGTEWAIVPGGIGPQTEKVFENIRTSLRAFGSDLEYIIQMTNYFVSYNDRALFSEVRRRYLPRPVPDAAVQVSSLSDPESAVEVEVVALVP